MALKLCGYPIVLYVSDVILEIIDKKLIGVEFLEYAWVLTFTFTDCDSDTNGVACGECT